MKTSLIILATIWLAALVVLIINIGLFSDGGIITSPILIIVIIFAVLYWFTIRSLHTNEPNSDKTWLKASIILHYASFIPGIALLLLALVLTANSPFDPPFFFENYPAVDTALMIYVAVLMQPAISLPLWIGLLIFSLIFALVSFYKSSDRKKRKLLVKIVVSILLLIGVIIFLDGF